MSDRISERLVHGNELLHDFDIEYQLDIDRENPAYTVEYIESALRDVDPPGGYPDLEGFSGFEVMASYLMLDAFVAGRGFLHDFEFGDAAQDEFGAGNGTDAAADGLGESTSSPPRRPR